MAKQTSKAVKPPKPVRKCVLQFRVTQEIYDLLAQAGQKHGLTISMEAVRRLEVFEKYEKAIERLQKPPGSSGYRDDPRIRNDPRIRELVVAALQWANEAGVERIATRAAEIAIQRTSQVKVDEPA
jgi:histone H3/H4